MLGDYELIDKPVIQALFSFKTSLGDHSMQPSLGITTVTRKTCPSQKSNPRTSLVSSGLDSMFPMLGAQVRSLVRELDPPCRI